MISTPSYPASLASLAARAKSDTVRSTCLVDIARGLNGVIGDFLLEAPTLSGL